MSNQIFSSFIFPALKSGLLLIALFLTGCFEQQKVIEPFVPSGNRVVLIEEFTGKGCTNCPKGSKELANLLQQFPNNLVAVSLHAGFFANPDQFHVGVYDLRTEEGEILIDYLTQPIGYPSGVVNRTPVAGDMQISLNQWASAITSAIQVPPAVELSIERTFDENTGQLAVTVNGIGKEELEGDIRLSVMITESAIIDAQIVLEQGGLVEGYEHNHVLRDMLTPATGASILTAITTGQTFSETYTATIDPSWVADNMEIIAFVSLVNGNSIPVIQATSIHLAE
jgi:hypothetical protein